MMVSFINSGSFVRFRAIVSYRILAASIITVVIGWASLTPLPALAELRPNPVHGEIASAQASGNFQLIGSYAGIGLLLNSIVAPGPTPDSERLYATYIYTETTFDILSIDPDTGNVTVFHNPVPGEWGAWALAAGPDGNIYLGTLPGAHLLKLDPVQGTLLDLGRPSSTESIIWSLALGSDNRLYGGTYPNCKLVRYDPATGQLEDLGRLDPIQEYARSIAASKDGFIYAGIGADANIAAYQISTSQHREILPPAAQSVTFPHVYVGKDGSVYSPVNSIYYRLSQFTATELGSGNAVPFAPNNMLSDGRSVTIEESLSASGSEVLTLVVSNPTTKATVEYPIAYQGEKMDLFRIGFGPNGVLYGNTSMPANFFQVDISRKSLEQIGIVGSGEVYSFLSHGNSLLMGAYAGLATLMSYQPGVAASSANPGLVKFQGDDASWRPEAVINGPNGNVYAGAIAGYGFVEAPLIEWNTESGSVQLYNVVPNQSVVSLAAWRNLIVGGTSINGGDGTEPVEANAQLFVWNPSTQEVEYQVAPVTGAASITDLIAAPNGLVYGIAGKTLFEFDPETQQITNSQTLPFTSVAYNSVSADNAGRIWGLAETGIFSIDTRTFNVAMVASSPLYISGGFAMGNGNIYFISGPSVYSYTIPAAPSKVSVSSAQTKLSPNTVLSVTATVTGNGITPTGTVTLLGGGYTSPAATLSGGSYTFAIPVNSLNFGTDTFTVSYGGDANYASSTGTTAVTVAEPTFTLTASRPAAIAPGSSATSTVTATGINGYAGTLALTCSLTSAPSNATDLPTCTPATSTVTIDSNVTTTTVTVTVSAPAATATLLRPGFGRGSRWLGTDGGVALAFLMCMGIPARRRSWRSMLGMLAVMAALGGLTACSGSAKGLNIQNNLGTDTGSYTFTVMGTGTPSVSSTPRTTFTLTVK